MRIMNIFVLVRILFDIDSSQYYLRSISCIFQELINFIVKTGEYEKNAVI
jgi:hypothetical protein